jgi:hypothetical protein
MPKELPPDPFSMNESRARWAGRVLSFCDRFGEPQDYPASKKEIRENLEGKLSDLVADLAHFCDREGLSMKIVVRGATRRYQITTDGQGTQLKARAKYEDG